MKRRDFLRAATASGAVGAVATSGFPKPALSQGRMEWRMVTAWPKNFPALGTGANLLAKLITDASGGRLAVKVFGAGEIVPAFEAMDAVSGGTAEMGQGAPYYWKGKAAALQFISSLPFGMNLIEQTAWFKYGGGQELSDKIYRELGVKFLPGGNTGQQMGGWFNKEMNSLEDFKGLKMRIPGLGGEVLKAAGTNVINLPGGEILPALQSGAIDATEWVGPYNDLAFGLYKTAKFYYYPGWQEPASVEDNFINIQIWEKLPDDLKAVVEAASDAAYNWTFSEFVARNSQSLDVLVNEHGVALKKFSDEILDGLGGLSGEVMNDLASQDPLSREVMDSILRFRKQAIPYAKISEQAFYNARALPFEYAEPSSG